MLKSKALFLGLMAVLVAGFALGGQAIPNWSAPATWSPSASGGAHTLDLSNPLPFIPVTPCRIADTRGNGFGGAYGPPSLGADTNRNFTITGVCGIPTSAHAVSFNFAALNVAGPGDMRVFPAGGGTPLVSTLNYTAATPNIANAAIVPLGTGGAITVRADVISIDLIIDVNGYYYDGNLGGTSLLAPGEQFVIIGNYIGSILYGENQSVVNGARAVRGISSGTSGITYGVLGQTNSLTNGAVGVRGEVGGSIANAFFGTIGVQGVDAGGGAGAWGVLGISFGSRGVQGSRTDSAGVPQASGVLGYSGSSGVHSFNDITAGGVKSFVQPHPQDASKEIRYITLEGNEAGTYFRGRGRFVNGKAVIRVPDDFQMVTEDDGMTVQITPLGRMAQVGVVSMDLYHIVAESSRDVEFSYLVQGVRRGYGGFKPIQDNVSFAPASASSRMDSWPQQTKDALVQLGIYNADGTVNMETAERLGWAQAWRDREEQARANAAARTQQLTAPPN